MFRKLLVANRGEIACRVVRTARRMGIATVAIYSDADRNALHVAMADEAVGIGAALASESYLRGDRIVAAALAAGAEAVHPGYGFLSENPGFVDQVTAAGLVFVGPSAAAIRAMGLKDAAKRLMEKAGVPVVPGYHGDAQAIVVLAGKANEIGYPVLIKARAGGGGKGMRRVDHPDDFPEALAAAKREAKSAFGDDHVLVEKYVATPRHIEVQVFGDSFGNAVHLFERDCSAQRRHQKVIEEAPAPGMTEAMRTAMTNAAVAAARAIGYAGAGTIEFIVDASEGLRPDRFWFMEMNTRLQVEHPVTEMVTGLDLVEWQLRVAAGEKLPLRQEEIRLDGHAFEARIYAEDPGAGFLPATGTLHHLRFPDADAALRIETGVRQGDGISPYYDPMIAKLVAHGPDRPGALALLREALDRTEIAGCTTNVSFLGALARDDAFAAGEVDTGLIARRQTELTASPTPSPRIVAEALKAASGLATVDAADANSWKALAGYAHFHPLRRSATVILDDRSLNGALTMGANGIDVAVETPEGVKTALTLPSSGGSARVAPWPGHVTVFDRGDAFTFGVPDPFAVITAERGGAASMRAPMPGIVKLVRASIGDSVSKGQPLLVLEAMKMEHAIIAARDGTIAEIATEGAQVAEGTPLVRFAEVPPT